MRAIAVNASVQCIFRQRKASCASRQRAVESGVETDDLWDSREALGSRIHDGQRGRNMQRGEICRRPKLRTDSRCKALVLPHIRSAVHDAMSDRSQRIETRSQLRQNGGCRRLHIVQRLIGAVHESALSIFETQLARSLLPRSARPDPLRFAMHDNLQARCRPAVQTELQRRRSAVQREDLLALVHSSHFQSRTSGRSSPHSLT